MDSERASTIPLARATDPGLVGGKAAGLSRLIRLGLRVPDGFVVLGGAAPPDMSAAFRALGGPVAVRSSATDEDGGEASFAGQYLTVLEVEDEDALQRAVERCLASLEDAGAAGYRRDRTGSGAPPAMSVVVQRMVDARVAGVIFTVDPVTARRDHVVVDAVRGTGETLVGGQTEPDHFVLSRDGALRKARLSGEAPLLSEEELRRLVREALAVEADADAPQDLEWAIDRSGQLSWLQSRPITALASDPRELDTRADDEAWYTWANIGEMLPGAVCPLDLSTVVVGIDHGIQHMIVSCGVQPRIEPRLKVVGVFQGHLFFNLSSMLPFCARVGGSSTEQLAYAICGRTIPGFGALPPASRATRALNGLRYLRYVLRGEAEVRRLSRALQGFQIEPGDDPRATHAAIDRALPVLLETYRVHIQSSTGSGLTAGVLQGVIARGAVPTAAQEAELAELLAGARGVESADLVTELDELGVRLARARADLASLEPREALAWLRSAASGQAGRDFATFLGRHGHRAVRELSLRQPGWADDPLPLVQALQISGRVSGATRRRPPAARPSPGARALLAWSRRTVRRRERSKSLLVRVTDRFKRAYRILGDQLVARGALPEQELIFFLTHAELGELAGGDASLVARARARRQTFRGLRALRFPTLSTGRPDPVRDEPTDVVDGDTLSGQPVSPGVVEGVARVVHTVDQAASLQPGDILIAPVTDVGWSPYFRIIGGLATDVGSAISHGAVVAREYGLPAVVNLRAASRLFRSGERVRLDADRGTLSRLDPVDR